MNKKIRKVLLFIPPALTLKDSIDVNPLPPLGLAYLGAVLEESGIEVKIVDCLMEGWDIRVEVEAGIIRIGISFEQIEDIIRDYDPDIVGVNNLFSTQRKNAHKIYASAKKINRNIITVAGGAHPTVMPELVLSDKNVDFVVLGEGEETILEIIKVIEGEKNISSIDGVGFRENGKMKVIPKTKFIENLDKIPFPARHLLNMEKYFGLKESHGSRRKKRFSPIITSRGCSAGCTFCSAHKVWGKKFRYRSPENVVAEMKQMKEKYGIEEIMFEDDNLTLNVRRAEKIFDLMLEEKLDFVWDTPNGIATFALTENLIDKMKQSGCYTLNFPMETGSQYVMDNIIKKPLKIEKAKRLMKYARKIGLNVGMFIVIGMPGEKEEQMWESFRLVREMEIFYPHISIATPYPGTELYDICIAKKYLHNSFSLDDLYIRSFPISTEDWDRDGLKDIFRRGQRFLILSHFEKKPIDFVKRFTKKLFTKPGYMTKRIYNFVINGKN